MRLHIYSDYIIRSQAFDGILEKYPNDEFLKEEISALSGVDSRD